MDNCKKLCSVVWFIHPKIQQDQKITILRQSVRNILQELDHIHLETKLYTNDNVTGPCNLSDFKCDHIVETVKPPQFLFYWVYGYDMEKVNNELRMLRLQWGVKTFMIALQPSNNFKDAFSQVMHCRINLTMLPFINALSHDIVNAEAFQLTFNNISSLIHYILKRENVHWFHTLVHPRSQFKLSQTMDSNLSLASKLLQFAQTSRLFCSQHAGGNVSVKLSNKDLIITPRQEDKSKVKPQDMVYVTPNLSSLVIDAYCESYRKSSIDTGVQSYLYDKFPHIDAFLHFHYSAVVVRPHFITNFGFPCGCIEEAKEIHQESLLSQIDANQIYSVELKHHGYLLGLDQSSSLLIFSLWDQLVSKGYSLLKKYTSSLIPLPDLAVYPCFDGCQLLGCIFHLPFLSSSLDVWGIYVNPGQNLLDFPKYVLSHIATSLRIPPTSCFSSSLDLCLILLSDQPQPQLPSLHDHLKDLLSPNYSESLPIPLQTFPPLSLFFFPIKKI